jgi:hypothetical protein
VLAFLGFAGENFKQQEPAVMTPGRAVTVGEFDIRIRCRPFRVFGVRSFVQDLSVSDRPSWGCRVVRSHPRIP